MPDKPHQLIGYASPPVESRWKPGQSGNPKGRKPGSRSFRSVFLQAANAKPMTLCASDKPEEATILDQAMAKLFRKAALGHEPALHGMIALARELMPDDDDEDAAAPDVAEEASDPCKPSGIG